MFDYSLIVRRIQNRKDKWIGMACSFSFHFCLLLIGGMLFIKPIEFGVDAGMSGMEVQLVAGPSEVEARVSEPVEKVPVIQEEVPPAAEQAEKILEEVVKEPVPQSLGNSTINAVAAHGATTQLQPSYLSNPAPRYPLEARRNGWEGVVLLNVSVNNLGYSTRVDIVKSSGYEVLDNAAAKTIKEWKFRPAKLGSLAVESSVQIPIRFEIEKEK